MTVGCLTVGCLTAGCNTKDCSNPPHEPAAGDLVGNYGLDPDVFCGTVQLKMAHVEFHLRYLHVIDEGEKTFEWTVPADATIVFGQGKPGVAVAFGEQGGDLCVTVVNACGRTRPLCKQIEIFRDGSIAWLNPFPGGPRRDAVGFAIGGRGSLKCNRPAEGVWRELAGRRIVTGWLAAFVKTGKRL
jgi:hypothetical protein